MTSEYEVIIIGAGLGGIASALVMAKNGIKTLLIESKGRLGGRFSTINYQGFKLPTGGQLVHKDGWIPWMLKEAGVKVELRHVPRLFYRIRGQEYEMPDKGRFRMLLEFLDKAETERAKIAGNVAKEVAASMLISGMAQARTRPHGEPMLTLRDWLMQYTDNEIVHDIFDQLAASAVMGHSWEIPASVFFDFMAKSGGQRDLMLAPGGTIGISEAVAEVITPVCDIWTDSNVRQILIKKGKVTGVVVEKNGKNEEVSCKAVISDIGPTATVQIAGKENFNAEYLKQMRMKLRPSPCVLIMIASDRPLCLEGKTAILITIGARRFGGIVPLTNTCPELAPPGQHLLYVVAEPKSGLLPMDEEYEKQQCMLDLNEQFPDFEKNGGRILVMEPRNIDHEWPETRTWLGYSMPIETPISNLFTVGDACVGVGLSGSSASVENGTRAAATVLKMITK